MLEYARRFQNQGCDQASAGSQVVNEQYNELVFTEPASASLDHASDLES